MIEGKKIGIIILNYKDAETIKHLIALIGKYHSIDDIVIVDNLSPDNSFNRLQSIRNKKIHLIQTNMNGGYSYGNNFGAFFLIEKCQSDVIFIANPDVEFTEMFLIQMVKVMETYQVQAASGYMIMPNGFKHLIRNTHINSFRREVLDCTIILKHIFPYKGNVFKKGQGKIFVEWIPGSLFAIDANSYKKIHGLDEHVFLFYEEQILGKKFQQEGYKMIIDTDVSYIHNHSTSINKSIKRYEQVKQLYQSKWYFCTHYMKIGLIKKMILRIIIFYGLSLRRILYKFM